MVIMWWWHPIRMSGVVLQVICLNMCYKSQNDQLFLIQPCVSGSKLQLLETRLTFENRVTKLHCSPFVFFLLLTSLTLRCGHWKNQFSKTWLFFLNDEYISFFSQTRVAILTASHCFRMVENSSTAGKGNICIRLCRISDPLYGGMLCVLEGLSWWRKACISSCFSLPVCHQLDATSSWWLYTKGPGSRRLTQTLPAHTHKECCWTNLLVSQQQFAPSGWILFLCKCRLICCL